MRRLQGAINVNCWWPTCRLTDNSISEHSNSPKDQLLRRNTKWTEKYNFCSVTWPARRQLLLSIVISSISGRSFHRVRIPRPAWVFPSILGLRCFTGDSEFVYADDNLIMTKTRWRRTYAKSGANFVKCRSPERHGYFFLRNPDHGHRTMLW